VSKGRPTVIKTHYSHKQPQQNNTGFTVIKRRLSGPSDLVSARNASVSSQNLIVGNYHGNSQPDSRPPAAVPIAATANPERATNRRMD